MRHQPISGAQQFKWNATLHGPILGLALRF
jgi:hypothetical protein